MGKFCTALYLCFLTLIFPLYYQDNYINILEAKTKLFTIGTILFIIAILVGYWFDSVRAYEAEQRVKSGKKSKKKKEKQKNIAWLNIFFWIFIAMVLISTVLSGDIGNAWQGAETKLFGTKMILLCAGCYIVFSKGFLWNRIVKYSVCIGTFVVCTLAVLNRFNIDVLHMYDNLLITQKPIYVSTIGNVNILSAYLCVFVPLLIGLYLYAEKKEDKVLFGLMTTLGVMTGITTNSDSFFLGFGCAMLAFLWFALTSKGAIMAYFDVCILSAIALELLVCFTKVCKTEVTWEVVQGRLLADVPWLLIIAAFVTVRVLLTKINETQNWKKIRNIIFGVIGVVTIFFAGFVAYGNLSESVTLPKMLTFNKSWGTNRGFAWSNTVALFGKLPFHEKVFGIGPGAFYDFFREPNQLRKIPFVDPHNDYLYYLVTTGIIGFVAWLAMGIRGLYICFQKKNVESIILCAMLASWLAQAVVNTSIVFTAPYFFVILGICRWTETQKASLFC